MAKTAALIALAVVAIGFGVPIACIYFSVYHEFNVVLAGIITIVALVIAGGIGFFGIVTGPLGELGSEGVSASEREKLNMMRAHQRATLEEMDDIIAVLRDIRDVLKTAEE